MKHYAQLRIKRTRNNDLRVVGVCGAAIAASLGVSTHAAAETSPFSVSFAYTADITAAEHASYAIDNIEVFADLDLAAFGWRGATLHGHVLRSDDSSEEPGTLQGITNLEGGRPRVRVHEFWIEQQWNDGASSLRAGVYDINSEFYVTESAELFINPSFGIGPEFAAISGDEDPIVPPTALSVRYRHAFHESAALKLAVFTLGDPGGAEVSFDDGVLFTGEVDFAFRSVDVALGAWRFNREQDDIRDVDIYDEPEQRAAQGLYALLEAPLWGAEDEPRNATGFLRAGWSDGDTGEVSGSWQAGLVLNHVFSTRPDSTFGIGVTQARLSAKHRHNAFEEGFDLAGAETILELSYADSVTDWLSLQPSVQWVDTPEGDRNRDDAVAGILRLVIER